MTNVHLEISQGHGRYQYAAIVMLLNLILMDLNHGWLAVAFAVTAMICTGRCTYLAWQSLREAVLS